jgi:hypothetical protein
MGVGTMDGEEKSKQEKALIRQSHPWMEQNKPILCSEEKEINKQ